MLKWLVKGFHNFRSSLDYPRYEEECRIRHLEVAEEKYETSILAQKLFSLERNIQSNAYDQFGKTIELINNKNSPYIIAVEKNTLILHILQRDYKAELSRLYDVSARLSKDISSEIVGINIIKVELRNAFEEKDDAYKRLQAAKDNIDWWHTKSQRTTWLGGNKGKQIPNHSFFGQSFGDLEDYKSDRDGAYQEIDNAKNKISCIRRQIDKKQKDISNVKSKKQKKYDEIMSVKIDRAEKFRFKKEGVTKDQLRKEIAKDSRQRDHYQAELAKILKAKDEFIIRSKNDAGTTEIASKIERIQKEKIKFISDFDSDAETTVRKESHRQMWINQRNSGKS